MNGSAAERRPERRAMSVVRGDHTGRDTLYQSFPARLTGDLAPCAVNAGGQNVKATTVDRCKKLRNRRALNSQRGDCQRGLWLATDLLLLLATLAVPGG